MKRAELEVVCRQAAELHAAGTKGCPQQFETLGNIILKWTPVVSYFEPGKLTGTKLDVLDSRADSYAGRAMSAGEMSERELARLLGLKAALAAWERNEGEWPMAKSVAGPPADGDGQ